jgi:hypothetical protein
LPGTDKQLLPDLNKINLAGWETLTEGARNYPCREGPWVFQRNGIYYLTYATPGTASKWYSDGLYTSNNPMGPFAYHQFAPVSTKPGGFIGSVGHSCIFQDKHGNWWQIASMWIGVSTDFERRLGLFPVEFDVNGDIHTHTEFGDYPVMMPTRAASPQSLSSGWNVLTHGKGVSVTTSSMLTGHPAELAIDENVRTWWSAATGNSGEWLKIDLGKKCAVNAVQVNFAEQDCQYNGIRPVNDYHQYKLYASADNRKWTLIIDRSENKKSVPHDYLQLNKPVFARYLKIENQFMAANGKFAIRDLRAFGNGLGNAPQAVNTATVLRDKNNLRDCNIRWSVSPAADGYLIRYGIEKNKWLAHYQVTDGTAASLWLHTLANNNDNYYFRIDAYNSNGCTEGKSIAVTQLASNIGLQAIVNGDYYQIVNRKTGKTAEAEAGNWDVQQNTANHSSDQLWKFELLNDGSYKITNKSGNKVLEVKNADKNRKADMQLADWNGADNQKWIVEFSEKGHIKLLNKNSYYYLDVPNASDDNGIKLEQNRYFDYEYQEWNLVK